MLLFSITASKRHHLVCMTGCQAVQPLAGHLMLGVKRRATVGAPRWRGKLKCILALLILAQRVHAAPGHLGLHQAFGDRHDLLPITIEATSDKRLNARRVTTIYEDPVHFSLDIRAVAHCLTNVVAISVGDQILHRIPHRRTRGEEVVFAKVVWEPLKVPVVPEGEQIAAPAKEVRQLHAHCTRARPVSLTHC